MASDGTVLPKRIGDEVITRMWDYFEEGIEYSDRNFDDIKMNVSFVDYYNAKVEEDIKDETRREYQTQIVELLGGIVATEIGKQDLRNLHLEKPIPGGKLQSFFTVEGFNGTYQTN